MMRRSVLTGLLLMTTTGLPHLADQGDSTASGNTPPSWCAALPRPENDSLPRSEASDSWFHVYESGPGVFSIIEPLQFQETISHLIIGKEKAVLFDTGIGLLPIRPVVERLTSLPITVLNSHTHYDHVGGNHEFSTILAIDTEYTKTNMAGFDHQRIAAEFAPDAFCEAPPAPAETATITTKPWTATAFVEDGDTLDLGGRRLQVLHIPGHTPDAIALFDAANGLLFTGDTFYDARLWLYVPETNLDDYQRSLARLVAIEGDLHYLFGAHNIARVEAGRLRDVQRALAKLRSGEIRGVLESPGQLAFEIDGIRFLTAPQVLAGRQGDVAKGGSGLDHW